jgi:membrane protein
LRPAVLLALLARAVRSSLSTKSLLIARSAAFSAALALFPGLVVLATLLVGNNANDAVQALSQGLGEVLPAEVHALLVRYLTVGPVHSVGLLVGMGVIAILFATEMMVTLMEAFRSAYRLPRSRAVWHERWIGFVLVVLAAIPITAATGVMVFSHYVEEGLKLDFGDTWWLLLLSRTLQRLIVLVTTTVVLAIFYHVAPHREQRWRDVVPGAFVAAFLWLVSTELFSLYLVTLAPYRSIYGSVSTVVVMLIWLYLVSIFVMIGCEFNVEREARLREQSSAA